METVQLSLDVNSDAGSGAKNIDALGARFEIYLDEPIKIPHFANNCSVRIDESTVNANTAGSAPAPIAILIASGTNKTVAPTLDITNVKKVANTATAD